MPNVVTPFIRRRSAGREATFVPRHRREGYFDEQDQWHDAAEAADVDAARSHA